MLWKSVIKTSDSSTDMVCIAGDRLGACALESSWGSACIGLSRMKKFLLMQMYKLKCMECEYRKEKKVHYP